MFGYMLVYFICTILITVSYSNIISHITISINGSITAIINKYLLWKQLIISKSLQCFS